MSIIICKATVLLPQPITAQPKSPLVLSNQSPLNPWETIANFLHQTSKTPEISNSFAFFVHLPNIIPNHPLNEQHKSQLLQFYVSLFQKLDLVSIHQFAQKDLMYVIETMISYNVRFGMDMSVTVWNQFFVSYYKRPMQFRDVYVIKLLTKCMNLPGSNVEPNSETFHVILYGIAHQQIASNRKTILIKYIIKYMKETNGDVPTTLSVYNPLVFDAILSNEEYHEVIRILFAHPKWTFPAAQSNITFFNTLLKYLPSYVEMHRLNLGKSLKFMMNGIMTRHGVVNNVETYKILKDYYLDDGHFASSPKSDRTLAFMQINQTNTEHNHNMYQIIQRFKRIDLGKDTIGYKNYDEFVKPYLEQQTELVIPSAELDCSKRVWDTIVRTWRRNLHEFDNIRSSDEGLQILSQIEQFIPTGPLRKTRKRGRGLSRVTINS